MAPAASPETPARRILFKPPLDAQRILFKRHSTVPHGAPLDWKNPQHGVGSNPTYPLASELSCRSRAKDLRGA